MNKVNAQQQNMELLGISAAHKAFRTPEGDMVRPLDGVNLSIRNNEFLTLLGPSGCGKTTLLKTIAGFEDLDDGEMTLDGQSIGAIPAHRRPFNTVFQNYALFPHLSVAENVAYGLEVVGVPKGERLARVTEALRLVSLTGMERRRPTQLSGGQQQRVALARALINRPRILLLDEPLSALDRKLRQSMQIELKNLQNTVGITFLLVTHDQEEALSMSDRIAVMDRGRILQLGTPTEIYDTPTDRFVASFIGTSNIFTGMLNSDRQGRFVKIDSEIDLRIADIDIADGEAVDIVMRPEQLLLASPHARPDNSLDVTLENIVFVGSDLHLHGHLRNGAKIIALHRHARNSIEIVPAAGQTIQVSYAPSAPHVMPAVRPQ